MMKRVSSFKSYREFPKNQEKYCISGRFGTIHGAMETCVGMLRGMDGEGLKMASEQRTDYRKELLYRLRWVRPL